MAVANAETTAGAAAVYYFIDDNRAYRGPVTFETLHLLFATEAITPNTYVFADSISKDHSWIRLKRVPELLAQLRQPLPDASEAGGGAPADAPAASTMAEDSKQRPSMRSSQGGQQASTATPREDVGGGTQGSSGAIDTAADDAEMDGLHPKGSDAVRSVPRQKVNPTIGRSSAGGSSGAIDVSDSDARPGAEASAKVAALAPQPAPQPAANPAFFLNQAQPRDCLYADHFANAPKATSKQASPRRGFFGIRKPAKSAFGKPLAACELDSGTGVPVVLVQLRDMLFSHNGQLVEGIFRVSPAQSLLKAAQQDAERNQFSKVAAAGPESIATLIKLWFRKWRRSPLPYPPSPLPSIPQRDPSRPFPLVGPPSALPPPPRPTFLPSS